MMGRRYFVIFALLLSLAMGVGFAIQPTALPEFELSTLDGQAVKSLDLAGQGHWLLICVQPNHQFSERLLKLLKREDYPQVAANAIVVVLGTAEEAKVLKAAYPDLATARWYADNSRNAFSKLKLHGVPVIVGLDKKVMLWNINGVLPDLNTEKSIVNTWLQ